MKIVDACWTPKVNILIVECPCGETIRHPSNRWSVKCKCGNVGHLSVLRDIYVKEFK